MSKAIDKQGIEGRSGYCANGPMGVSSSMSKTRSKLGNEVKWRDFSNVSKTIEKQGTKGRLKYCANGPIGVSSHMYKTRLKQDIDENGGISPMCLKPLRSNILKEVWDIAPMGQ